MARACGVPVGQRSVGLGDIPKIINRKTIYRGFKKKIEPKKEMISFFFYLNQTEKKID